MALTKKQRRKLRQENVLTRENTFTENFRISPHIQAKTFSQKRAANAWADGKNLIMSGCAGTGKTFMALKFAIDSVMANGTQERVHIFRSAVPSRDIGHMPGDERDKMSYYEGPYHGLCNNLFERDNAYSILKARGLIKFESTSYLRGLTYDDSIMVVDEFQNMSGRELHTLITRVGDNARIIFCGDVDQTDLLKRAERDGYADFVRILDAMEQFEHIEFGPNDVVRSGLVQDYIRKRAELKVGAGW